MSKDKITIEIGVSEINGQTEIRKAGDGLVKAKEAERILTVTDNTLFRWEKSGYLTPVRIGSKRMYKVSDLEAILKGEKVKPKSIK